MKIVADARLAVPSLLGWASLVVVLNLGATDGHDLTLWAWVAAAIMCAGAALTMRTFPSVGLAAALATALLVGLALRAPFHVEVLPWNEATSETPWFLSWADVLRHKLLDASASLPGTGGQLVPGLAIGDTSRVSQALQANMKAVSLTHITAVSGANCAIVTASTAVIAARMGASRRVRIALALVVLVAFVVLVTPQPSVVRAAVMSGVVLIAMFSGRPGSGLPMLALAMTGILLWNPWWAIDYGFVLSVTATLGLLVFSGPLTRRLSSYMPATLAAIIAIPLSAQLLCQPAIILLTPQIPTYGILANVIAGPAAPLATVAGLLACLTLPCIPAVGLALTWATWLPAEWIGQVAQVCAGLPLPQLPWLAGWLGAGVLAATSAAILVIVLARSGALRLCAICALASGVIFALSLTVVPLWVAGAKIPQDWQIAACDVGQGDALVVRSENNYALIDTGKDVALLTSCLKKLGINRINLLVLTHYDQDHVGAVKSVFGKVDTAIVGPPEDARGDNIVSQLAAGGAKVVHGLKGMRGQLGSSTWDVLWPAPDHPSMQSGNPGSVTVLFHQPGVSSLFLGDLGEDAQQALLSTQQLPLVDVVKVAHHGSADQSPALYESIHARIDLVSVGAGNSYGHPTAKTLALLGRLGGLIARTDQSGLLLLSSAGGDLHLWRERGG